MYVGTSSAHASTVGLCLNLSTGAISPQYHVVYDDEFTTVGSTTEALEAISSPEWQKLFGDSIFQYVQDDDETVVTSNPTVDAILNRQDTIASLRDPHPLAPFPPLPPPASDLPTPPWLEPVTSAEPPSSVSQLPHQGPVTRSRQSSLVREQPTRLTRPPMREPLQRERPSNVTPTAPQSQ